MFYHGYIEKSLSIIMVKQISLDAWQIQQLSDLLKKGSDIVAKTNRPIIMYRQTQDEEEE